MASHLHAKTQNQSIFRDVDAFFLYNHAKIKCKQLKFLCWHIFQFFVHWAPFYIFCLFPVLFQYFLVLCRLQLSQCETQKTETQTEDQRNRLRAQNVRERKNTSVSKNLLIVPYSTMFCRWYHLQIFMAYVQKQQIYQIQTSSVWS